MNKKFKYCFQEGKLVKCDEHNEKSSENETKRVKVDEVIFEKTSVKF